MIQILRCSRPKVCPELYLSLEDNFIFIADHEPYPVDVGKKGKNTNTLQKIVMAITKMKDKSVNCKLE